MTSPEICTKCGKELTAKDNLIRFSANAGLCSECHNECPIITNLITLQTPPQDNKGCGRIYTEVREEITAGRRCGIYGLCSECLAKNKDFEKSMPEMVEKILKEIKKKDNWIWGADSYTEYFVAAIQKALKMGYDKKAEEDLKMIDGLDDLFLNKSSMNYSKGRDTWTILKQSWNKIVEELKQKISEVGK